MKLFKVGVLVIHGFSSSIMDVEKLVNDLNLEGKFDTFAFTLSGHNKYFLNHVTYEDFINDADKQINYLISHGYNKIYVVGHSMGGLLGVYLATKYKQVKKLVLVAPGLFCGSIKQYGYDLCHALDTFRDNDVGYLTIFRKAFTVSPSVRRQLWLIISKYRHLINDVKCPVLILQGDKDEVVPEKTGKYALEHVKSKHKTLIMINGGRHNLINGTYSSKVILYIHTYLKGGLKWILMKK